MKKFIVSLLAVVVLGGCGNEPEQVVSTNAPQTSNDTQQPQILAPGYTDLTFDAPEPGTYELPPISDASNGSVLNADGESVTLHELYDGKIVLLSFIYSTCTDVNGCPLATAVFHKVKNRLKDEADLTENLQLLSLSFDPQNDTPEIMKLYGQGFKDKEVDWKFLTTESEDVLNPILDDYIQSTNKEYDEDGNPLGTFSHVLHVYLIDTSKKIRNIYSVSFLHPDILIADIKTLMMENESAAVEQQSARASLDN